MAYKQNGIEFGEGSSGVRENLYSGMKAGVRARKEARAAKVAEKAADRFAEGKKLSKRQQKMADEFLYNQARNQEIETARANRGSKSDPAKTETTSMPEVKVEANMSDAVAPGTKKQVVQGNRPSGVKNPEKSEAAGVNVDYTADEIKQLNTDAKPDAYGVTVRYVKGKDGNYEKSYRSKDLKASESSMRKAWTKKFGKDAVFPTDDGRTLSDAIKLLG